MTKGEDSHLVMAHAHQSDSHGGIFDQNSPSSYYSRNSYESSPSSSFGSDRGHHRSSSSSGSPSRSRSRSHPRCHRHSHCRSHRRYSRGRRHPARRYGAHSRSSSRSPSLDRYHGHRRRPSSTSRSKSRSRSSFAGRRYSRAQAHLNRFPRSPSRSYRSPSRSSGSSVSLTLEDKRELLEAAKNNAMKLLGVEKLALPESVKPILPEQVEEPQWLPPQSKARVRPRPEKTSSESNEAEAIITSPKMAAKPKTITFNINNCVAKPCIMAQIGENVTARVDSYESRKPYGHWVPVMSMQSARPRKQVRNKSR